MRYLLLFLPIFLFGSSLDQLLQEYKATADLSKLTKKESAGVVQVFTRQELEKMQAYTLADVMRLIGILNYTLAPNNIHLFSLAGGSFMPTNALRIYLNDHDITSASFGSSLPTWGNMPIEFIDHIEIYKGTSSIEFGNEPAALVVRLYTKTPKRDSGNKIRVISDTRKSAGLDLYRGSYQFDSSYFLYAHADSLRYKTYYRDGFKINRDSKSQFLFGSYQQGKHSVEIAFLNKHDNPFLGNGKSYHPTGGGLDTWHGFIHYKYDIGKGLVELAYDRLYYDRVYKDRDGVYINANGPAYVKNFHGNVYDDIYTVSIKKDFAFDNFETTLGAFYKRKELDKWGLFDGFGVSEKIAENMYSLYTDTRYYLNGKKSMLFVSLKEDYYTFNGNVKSRWQDIIKIGAIHQYQKHKFKLTLTDLYFALPLYQLQSKNDLPLKANPDLKFPRAKLAMLEYDYKDSPWQLMFRVGKKEMNNGAAYSPVKGFYNISKKMRQNLAESEARYYFDPLNFVILSLYYGKFQNQPAYSPKFGAILRLFNSWEKFDIYNELIYRSHYHHKRTQKTIDPSLDYTLAIKYHLNKDLSFGIKAQNLFGTGFEQAYYKIDETYPVVDRKVLFNMEYTF